MDPTNELPEVPTGLNAYREWVRWPYQRIGVRAYLRSTYDRTGHNHTADASHYLYQESEDFNVTLDVEGSGILYFVRTNRWHGSPWHYEIDNTDHVIEETTTANPLQPLTDSVFIPTELFPEPLAYTYAITKGADLNWVPMPFQERLRLAYSRTYYGTGYYIFHLFAQSQGEASWRAMPPDRDIPELLAKAGEDLSPASGLTTHEGRVNINVGITTLVDIKSSGAMVRKLRISAPAIHAKELGEVRLRITWDDRAASSVDAPLNLFHGAGSLHNPDAQEWLVKAFPVSVRFADERVHLACYIPMPFFKAARIGLQSEKNLNDVTWEVAIEPYAGPTNHVGYFHATYRDHGEPTLGLDLEFLDTNGIEGAEQWSGSIIGTSFIFTHRNILTTLEGDPRFYFDDSQTPQVQGTGTEEWGGGGDYWGGRTMSLPLAGHPTGIVDSSAAKHGDELIHSAYRFLVADLMPFGKRARVGFEHGGENESVEHYKSVTYWYGLPAPSLILTDRINIGDEVSETAHDYFSPDASAPYSVISRYEWGPDHLPVAIANPLSTPRDYVEFEFDAAAGEYDVWVEVRVGPELFDAAIWIEVNEHIGTGLVRPEYMGSMGIMNAGRQPGAFIFTTGVRPASSVTLLADGRQRLRIQPRHGQFCFSRIVLSPDRKRRPTNEVELAEGEIMLTPADAHRYEGAFDVVDEGQAPDGHAFFLAKAPEELEIFPAQEMVGRQHESFSEFNLALDPDNHGVLLRRTLDYHFANQRARVLVQDETSTWSEVGVWYLAGSNTVYHSFPWMEGELAPVKPEVIISNRRFRDDEFLLPAHLTRGKRQIRLRLEFAPRNPPLLPHLAPQPTAWTEFEYNAYCYVLPRFEIT